MMTNLIKWNERSIELTKDIGEILPSIKNSLEQLSTFYEKSPKYKDFKQAHLVLKNRLNDLIKDNSDVEKSLCHIDGMIGNVKQVIATLREEKY